MWRSWTRPCPLCQTQRAPPQIGDFCFPNIVKGHVLPICKPTQLRAPINLSDGGVTLRWGGIGSWRRFAAAVEVEKQLAADPEKQHLLLALQKRRLRQYDGFMDHMMTELFLTGD